MGFPSGAEWFVILVVALLLFGKRLPEVARSMGKSVTEFKRGLQGIDDVTKDVYEETKAASNAKNVANNQEAKENKGDKP